MSTRRTFLAAAGLTGLAGLATACSGEPAPAPVPATAPPPPVSTTTRAPAGAYVGDARAVALCAALSALVADLYSDAVDAAGRGRFGAFPGALGTFLQAAGDQHAEHAASWNALLVETGLPAMSGTPLTVEPAQRAALAAALAPVDLAELALALEGTVAATVTAVLGEISDAPAVALAAGVAPVAGMHAATVSFLLGRPVPAPVDPTAGALGRDALVP